MLDASYSEIYRISVLDDICTPKKSNKKDPCNKYIRGSGAHDEQRAIGPKGLCLSPLPLYEED